MDSSFRWNDSLKEEDLNTNKTPAIKFLVLAYRLIFIPRTALFNASLYRAIIAGIIMAAPHIELKS